MSWLEILYAERIPAEHWNELYRRAFSARAARIAEADDPEAVPMVSAESMVVQWRQMRREVVPDRPALTGYAGSQCPLCYGSGWMIEKVPDTVCDRNGKPLTYSRASRCEHLRKPDPADRIEEKEEVRNGNWYEKDND